MSEAVTIAIVNQSSAITDAELLNWLPALQTQVSRDVTPFWGTEAALVTCLAGQAAPPYAWPVYILDHSDIQGDLGYHDDDEATPSARIFAADDREYGALVPVTISHEIVEMLGDPSAQRMAPDGRHILELCDPVEADADGYDIAGADGAPVRVSNFVLPAWFGLANPGEDRRVDFRGLLTAPYALRPGGYAEYWDGTQWTQRRARLADGSHSRRSQRHGRSFRRARRGAPEL